jgi:WW domain-containing oxidoreductase
MTSSTTTLGFHTTADQVAQLAFGLSEDTFTSDRLAGRNVVVTGGNSGIGYETARVLANHGAHVVLACRSLQKAKEAADRINAEGKFNQVSVFELDISSLKAVQQTVQVNGKDLPKKIDILINNAGIMATPEFTLSAEGLELQFATNHLGHYLFTKLLMDRLADDARVVNLSSRAHNRGKVDFENNMPPKEELYSPLVNYGISKCCNILYSRQLQKVFNQANSKRTAYSLHPGVIPRTELFKTVTQFNPHTVPDTKTIPQGAATTLYCALHSDVLANAGEYFNDCALSHELTEDAKSEENARKLWDLSEELVKPYSSL